INYKELNNFLIENTPKNSNIFYPNWSMFPRMFYYNTHNRYTTAFDPVFLYNYNPEIYWIWFNITKYGAYCDQEWPCLELTPVLYNTR
ncbi:hypothetical protein KJ836_00660, partial [Patescibacteria group bacterium]|nr:hypothetical protein [Patescibacteria group bacterium]